MRLVLGMVAAAFVALFVAALPASVSATGGDDEVRKEGSCSRSADWEMRAKWDSDDRIELRGEVDHTASGQAWAWKIKHNGSVSASGRMTSRGGGFEIRRSLVDLAGVDRCVFRAERVRTGEVCRGVIDW